MSNILRILNIFFITDVADLQAKENRIDELIKKCTNELGTLTEDPENSRYPLIHKIMRRLMVIFP